ncbi:unnamed protein product [Calypogeia fissa]
MAVLQPTWFGRPVVGQRSPVMAGTVVMVSCASFGLDSRETGAKLLSRCSDNHNLAGGGWDDYRRRERWHVVMARRGGAGSPGAQRPSTSRGPPPRQQHESSSRNSSSSISRKKTQKEMKQEDDSWDEENDLNEDALEALFAQLQMDLEAGGLSDDEDFTEEEVIEFENELAAALRDVEEDEEALRAIDVVAGDTETGPNNDDDEDQIAGALEESEDEFDEERVVTLEPWQLRKLAAAVELGRRKVNIKALCAEVGMDRFDVLAWLKNPPPQLLMYVATMENEESTDELPEDRPAMSNSARKQDAETGPEGRQSWSSQKRLRKEHEATFERVFRNTDRPSNAIIQNLVELTHVPRKRIVEWFEERRKAARVSPKFEALR